MKLQDRKERLYRKRKQEEEYYRMIQELLKQQEKNLIPIKLIEEIEINATPSRKGELKSISKEDYEKLKQQGRSKKGHKEEEKEGGGVEKDNKTGKTQEQGEKGIENPEPQQGEEKEEQEKQEESKQENTKEQNKDEGSNSNNQQETPQERNQETKNKENEKTKQEEQEPKNTQENTSEQRTNKEQDEKQKHTKNIDKWIKRMHTETRKAPDIMKLNEKILEEKRKEIAKKINKLLNDLINIIAETREKETAITGEPILVKKRMIKRAIHKYSPSYVKTPLEKEDVVIIFDTSPSMHDWAQIIKDIYNEIKKRPDVTILNSPNLSIIKEPENPTAKNLIKKIATPDQYYADSYNPRWEELVGKTLIIFTDADGIEAIETLKTNNKVFVIFPPNYNLTPEHIKSLEGTTTVIPETINDIALGLDIFLKNTENNMIIPTGLGIKKPLRPNELIKRLSTGKTL